MFSVDSAEFPQKYSDIEVEREAMEVASFSRQVQKQKDAGFMHIIYGLYRVAPQKKLAHCVCLYFVKY